MGVLWRRGTTLTIGEVFLNISIFIVAFAAMKRLSTLPQIRGISLDLLSDYCAHPSAKSSHCVVVNFASIPTGHVVVAIELLETIFQKEILVHQR